MLPKTVDINCATYRVILTNRIPSKKGQRLDGLCCSATKKIWVRKSLDHDEMMSTFWHEILHALDFEYGLPSLNHQAIYELEAPLSWFFFDNPQISKLWIKSEG